MSFRQMRLVLFFDLPVETAKNRKDYRDFRKNIIKEGFIMLQESVYYKLVINRTALEFSKNRVKKVCPKEGSVFLLTVTEKQFSAMEIFCGELNFEVVDTTEPLVVL